MRNYTKLEILRLNYENVLENLVGKTFEFSLVTLNQEISIKNFKAIIKSADCNDQKIPFSLFVIKENETDEIEILILNIEGLKYV